MKLAKESKNNNKQVEKKKKVTVMILDERSTRTLQVNPFHLKALRPVLLLLTVIAVVLTVVCVQLAIAYGTKKLEMSRFDDEKADLQQQVADLRNATSEEVERKVKALSQSEKSIEQLQKYLKERGVKVKPVSFAPPPSSNEDINDAVGGPEIPETTIFQEVPYTGTYAKDVVRLTQAIKQVPLGLPHHGVKTSRFGGRANPFSGQGRETHMGLDFRARVGDPIRVTADGTVVQAGYHGGYGNLVRVRHGFGYETYYGHLSAIDVVVGKKISAGDVVGRAGSTGRSTGPHLHYEVRRNGAPIDPESFLSINAHVK